MIELLNERINESYKTRKSRELFFFQISDIVRFGIFKKYYGTKTNYFVSVGRYAERACFGTFGTSPDYSRKNDVGARLFGKRLYRAATFARKRANYLHFARRVAFLDWRKWRGRNRRSRRWSFGHPVQRSAQSRSLRRHFGRRYFQPAATRLAG